MLQTKYKRFNRYSERSNKTNVKSVREMACVYIVELSAIAPTASLISRCEALSQLYIGFDRVWLVVYRGIRERATQKHIERVSARPLIFFPTRKSRPLRATIAILRTSFSRIFFFFKFILCVTSTYPIRCNECVYISVFHFKILCSM